MKKRFLSLCLSLLILLPLIASCGDTVNVSENTTVAAVVSNEASLETTQTDKEELYLMDDIPAGTDLGGAVLRMLHWNDASADEFFVDDTNGETVNDAIFNRNEKVNSRLNVSFEYIGIPGNNSNREAFLKSAQNAAQGGDLYDIYASYSMSTALLAYNGLCANLLDYPVIDLEKPWWPESLTTEATIHNRLYFVSGDISTNLIYTMYAVYFNDALIDEYKLENPYTCVDNNTWTFEKMFTMAAATEASAVGADTVYGFTAASSVYLDPFFFAAGLRTVESDSEGKLTVSDSFHNEKTENVASMVWDFLHQNYCNFTDSKYTSFMNNASLFTMTTCLFSKTMLAGSTITYGVVPVPKYSADQESYTTLNGFTYTLYAISSFSVNKEKAAIALECMGSESFRIITPALFEITLKSRYAADNNASRMFDIIRESVTFDIGRIFTSSLEKLTYNIFRNNISAASKVSYITNFDSQKKMLNKRLGELNDVFANLENKS